jgi:hypothetical protein
LAVIGASWYAVSYFREKKLVLQEQNKQQSEEAARVASLTEPSISLDNLSCDIDAGAKIQDYSVTLRTVATNIDNRQRQIEGDIKAIGGSVISTSKGNVYDRSAGYIDSATLNVSIPIGQADKFISQLRSGLVALEYLENENNYVQDSSGIRQMCQSNLDYLKNLRSTEVIYLGQLNSGQISAPSAVSASDKSDSITKNLIELRQTASAYKSTIDSMTSRLNKANMNITIRGIQG